MTSDKLKTHFLNPTEIMAQKIRNVNYVTYFFFSISRMLELCPFLSQVTDSTRKQAIIFFFNQLRDWLHFLLLAYLI